MTAAEPGERHPAAGPETMARERLVAIFRAARQMPAGPPDQERKAVAVKLDQAAAKEAG